MVKDFMYVQFGRAEFTEARRGFLSSAVDTIRLLKRHGKFKELKAEENKIKGELKGEIKACFDGLNSFIESIPRVKEELENIKKESRAVRVEMPESAAGAISSVAKQKAIKKKSRLDSELEEIKARLAALG